MTQEKSFSKFTDVAWSAALASNEAFGELRRTEHTLKQLQEIGRLGLNGVMIEDSAYEILEEERTRIQSEFEMLTSIAAPAMLMQDSPFSMNNYEVPDDAVVTEESEETSWQPPRKIVLSGDGLEYISRADYDKLTREMGSQGIQMTVVGKEVLSADSENSIFEFDRIVRDLGEMEAFAKLREYDSQVYTNVYNALNRKARHVEVDSYEEYETTTADAAPGELTLVVILNRDLKIDIRSLYTAVKGWQEAGKADIPYFGVARISFLADYLNNAILDLEEPLVVTHTPKQSRSNKEQIQALHEEYIAKLRELPPQKLLLDTIKSGEDEKCFVTIDSFKRYVLARGYPSNKTIQVPNTFQDLFNYIDPDYTHDYYAADGSFVANKDDLFYERATRKGYNSNVRGIAPERFAQLIGGLEEAGIKIKSYGEFTRKLMHDYLDALAALNGSQEK